MNAALATRGRIRRLYCDRGDVAPWRAPPTDAARMCSAVGEGRARAARARATAIAKPTATGVNELRPPDATAAHQAARTMRPEASPTPMVSPAGASDARRPTVRATHAPRSRQTPPNSSAWPIESHHSAVERVIPNSAANDCSQSNSCSPYRVIPVPARAPADRTLRHTDLRLVLAASTTRPFAACRC